VALRQFLAGGFSGAITWTFSFPFDTIKTRMQAESGLKRSNAFQIVSMIIREHGFLFLYRGLHIQLMRGFPTSAMSMMVYEQVKRIIKGQ